LVNWARGVGKATRLVIVITLSDNGAIRRKPLVTLGCERGGKHKEYKNPYKRETIGTKKCECPFKLRGRLVRNNEG
jgi:hypothetical protein